MTARSVLIIGSGPACVGASLALVKAGIQPTVVDLGLTLDADLQAVAQRMAATTPERWAPDDVGAISHQPVKSLVDGLPEKRAYGSDFPFRDLGQVTGIHAAVGAHRSVVSAAIGGFSNVWGAQIMPFTPATFDSWPVSYPEMAPHYRAVLGELPYTAVDDDLSTYFPMVAEASAPPELAERSKRVLRGYERHREAFLRRGVVMGHARLALEAKGCVRCGLCMSGCPYGLIYSAAHTIRRLADGGLIQHIPGKLAVRLDQGRAEPEVTVVCRETGSVEVLRASKVIVACGALGSARLVAGSLSLFDSAIYAAESAQFTIPMVSLAPTADPRQGHDFTLNQFNSVVRVGPGARDLSQVHFYTYNPAFFDALPPSIQRPLTADFLLKRLSVAIGYVPSWASPRLRLRFAYAGENRLPTMDISREPARWSSNRMLRAAVGSLVWAAPRLDLWPVLPRTMIAAGGKTYHFGSIFPHSEGGDGLTTDRLGRLPAWRDIHLVDAAVFPNVPATTFTLTIMANAHRIAAELSS